MNVLGKLAQMDRFTPNEQSIATYILLHKNHILHLPIQELAKATYTSHSAIHRLTQKLGLSGYKEFMIRLAQEFKEKAEEELIVDTNFPFRPEESNLDVAKDLAVLMKETIEKNYSLMDERVLSEAASALHQAEKIFIYALGDSQIRATSFQNKMMKINKYVIVATDLSEWAHHTVNIGARDCAVFLTYHGKSPIFLKAAHYLKGKNIPLLTITSDNRSELRDLSTMFIQIPNDEEKWAKIGTFTSQISFDYVLNVLFSCVYQLDYTGNIDKATSSMTLLELNEFF